MSNNENQSGGSERLGNDPDLDGQLASRIKTGWALIGIFFTLGIFAALRQFFGIVILPPHPMMNDYLRLTAFIVGFLNIAMWMWFPLEDLAVLRRWVQTRKKIFPANTSEAFGILLAMTLLLLMIFGALESAFWFGVAGIAVYLWNLFGFAIIRKHIIEGLKEAHSIYAKQSPKKRTFYLQALQLIETHWSTRSNGLFSGRQQHRHTTIIMAFVGVVILALLGQHLWAWMNAAAYILGILTIVLAEIWIAIWRISRDEKLLMIQEELRGLARH